MLGSLNARPNVLGGDHAIFSKEPSGYQLQSPTTSTFSARSNRERLDDPSASMLDLDDDPRLSVVSDINNDARPSHDVSHDDSSHRLSYLGPNLRFHSRAPWETDEATLDDDEESSYGFLGSSRKAFGFSSSPRTSRRPSGESTRSHAKSKQSFETMSSRISYPRGALYALAQESLSTSSLGASAAAQKPVRSKTPVNRVRSDSSNDKTFLSSPTLVTHLDHTLLINSSQHEPPDTQSPSTSYHHVVYAADDFHPYANPDLGFQVLEERHHSPPKQGISRSDSIGTVTNSIAHNGLSRSETVSTLAPANPILSVNARNRTSAIQSREISSPISVVNTLHLDSKLHSTEDPFFMQPVAESLPGWTERVIYPGFSLISLEEARARKRSATSQPTVPPTPPSSSAPLSVMSHQYSHNSDNGRYNIEDGGFGLHSQRGRARSVSAGAKAKVVLHNIVGGGQPKLEADAGHAKTLKHRKSGFMRLFNGGRGQDKEEKLPPPPVPSLSDAYGTLGATQKAPKVAAYRDLAPDPSQSLEASLSSLERRSSPANVLESVKPSPSPKRPIPSLSINTQPERTPLMAKDDDFQTRTAPSNKFPQPPGANDSLPQSAPANVSDFHTLKLRPVSTAFSAHFGDHIVLPDCRPSLEMEVGTPSTRVFSPVTPGSASLSDGSSTDPKPVAFTNPISENRFSDASALQEQILNAKLAWQRQIWELESQVRDLKAEVDDLRKAESESAFCERCGRGQRCPKVESSLTPSAGETQDTKNLGVLNRPRARTGTSSRFGSVLP